MKLQEINEIIDYHIESNKIDKFNWNNKEIAALEVVKSSINEKYKSQLNKKIELLKRLITITELDNSPADLIWGLKTALYLLEI